MEQQLSTRLGERQVAEFVENHEVLPVEIIGQPPLASGSALGFKLVDQINDIEEPATRAATYASPRNRDGKMRLAGPSSADQHDVALMRQEVATDQVAHQRLVDRRACKRKLIDVLGQRQLGDGDLILDRTRLFSLISAVSKSPTMRCGSCWRFTAVAM